MVNKHIYSTHIYNSLLINVSVSLIVGEVLLHMTPCSNAQCECFNCTLFGLMKTLDSEQKPNWPIYLPSLVYAYNATPHASTGFQPYQAHVWVQGSNAL